MVDSHIISIEELTWRGMLHGAMPGTEAQLRQQMIIGYNGLDPTAASLHIGNLATVRLLVHFQRAVYKPLRWWVEPRA